MNDLEINVDGLLSKFAYNGNIGYSEEGSQRLEQDFDLLQIRGNGRYNLIRAFVRGCSWEDWV